MMPKHESRAGTLETGVIYLANEARFTSNFFSEPLTNYAVGWRDPNNIEATLDFLFPPVQVGRRFEYKSAVNTEAFLSEDDDTRAIGADFKRIEYKGTSVNDKTINKGLTIIIDDDEVEGQTGWEQTNVARLLQRLLRNELRRGITTVAAACTNTAKTWDTTAGKDPDQDILTDLIAGVDASGIRANRLLIGDVAWNKRAIAHRAQTTAGGFASASLTPDALAGLLGVSGIRISRERYQSTAAAKAKVLPDIVLQFYAEDGIGKDDPSHTKRFWSPVMGGGKYRVYFERIGAKRTAITVEHYSNCVVATSTGLRKLTIS